MRGATLTRHFRCYITARFRPPNLPSATRETREKSVFLAANARLRRIIVNVQVRQKNGALYGRNYAALRTNKCICQDSALERGGEGES